MKHIQIIAFVVIGVVFGAAGSWIFYCQPKTENIQSQLISQKQKLEVYANAKLIEIKNDRESIAKEIASLNSELKFCDEGTPLCLLTRGAINELKLADALLMQQMAALESNAPITMGIIETRPDHDLALELEREIKTTDMEIGEAKEAAKNLGGVMAIAAKTNIMTQNINLSILKRNYFIAKYGLNTQFDTKSAAIKPGIEKPQSVSEKKAEIITEDQGQTESNAASTHSNYSPTTTEEVFANQEGWEAEGNWATRKEESVMGDAKNIDIITVSPVDGPGRFGIGNNQARLCIRCANNKTELYVAFPDMLDSTNLGSYSVNIEYKIDDANIVKVNWGQSTDFKGAFAPKPVALIKELSGASKISFRAKKFHSNAVIETYFNLEGLAEAIKPVQNACGWK